MKFSTNRGEFIIHYFFSPSTAKLEFQGQFQPWMCQFEAQQRSVVGVVCDAHAAVAQPCVRSSAPPHSPRSSAKPFTGDAL